VQIPSGFPGFRLVPAPDGFWRVTDWHEPFAPKDAPLPVTDTDLAKDDAGRFDAPDGDFRTLYCASDPEGALGEKIAPFTLDAAVARRIDDFLDEEPDADQLGEELRPSLGAEDVDGFHWVLARAPSRPGARYIDLWSWATVVALLPQVPHLLARYGLRTLDVRALSDERRGFTRRLAGILRRGATTHAGELRAAGIRYDSRLPPQWTCWALWEPLPLDPDQAEIHLVTIETPALRRAAEMLGVVLRD
jgi:hypothetical protein